MKLVEVVDCTSRACRSHAPVHTDRTRLLEFQRCPRARWYGYEYGSRGLTPVRMSIPLATGLQVHEGLAHLLLNPVDVDGAVHVAVHGYDQMVADRGLHAGFGDDADFAHHEQRALVEGLIQAYAVRQLPQVLECYEVVEVEQENLLPMGVVQMRGEKRPLLWMARADALLIERESGDLYVLSFKTAATYDHRREAEAGHDVQGLSEIAAIEGRLNGWSDALQADPGAHVPAWFRKLWEANDRRAPGLMGVRMEYLLKGERREDRCSPGHWVQYSPLIRAWRRPDVNPGGGGFEYAWKYEWREEDRLTGDLRTRRLGRGWEPFNVWECAEVGGVKGWIELLAADKVQPEAGDCLAEQFVAPLPYFRQQADIEDWIEQAAAQEARVARASAAVDGAASAAEQRSLLNTYFPQHRRSCDWPRACPFQAICFGSDQIAADPVGSGLYTWREPHHEAERELVQLRPAA